MLYKIPINIINGQEIKARPLSFLFPFFVFSPFFSLFLFLLKFFPFSFLAFFPACCLLLLLLLALLLLLLVMLLLSMQML